jgi:hypothetical protein
MENENQLVQVKRVVEAKLGLYVHLVVYVLVNAALIGVNLATNPEHLWFQWPLIGWGAGLLFHAVLVLVCIRGGSIKAWMIARELKKSTKESPP